MRKNIFFKLSAGEKYAKKADPMKSVRGKEVALRRNQHASQSEREREKTISACSDVGRKMIGRNWQIVKSGTGGSLNKVQR